MNRGAQAMGAFRRDRQLTQAGAAALCEIDAQVWARFERGDRVPGLGNAARIQRGTAGAVEAVWFREVSDRDPQ